MSRIIAILSACLDAGRKVADLLAKGLGENGLVERVELRRRSASACSKRSAPFARPVDGLERLHLSCEFVSLLLELVEVGVAYRLCVLGWRAGGGFVGRVIASRFPVHQ